MVASLDGFIAKKDNSVAWFETPDYYEKGVAGQDAEGTHVNGVFQVSRYRDGITDIFIGRVRWKLVKQGDDILIRYKRCDLSVDELVPQGRLTIIL